MTSTPTIVSERDHQQAVLAALATIVGVTIGEGEAPSPAVLPYAVLYPIQGAPQDGTINDVERDAYWTFQVTCVGRADGEALLIVDKVRLALQSGGITVPGRKVLWVHSKGTAPAPREDTTNPALFYATPRFELCTSPST